MVWWSAALRRKTMPCSFLSDTLKPMMSVQNLVVRSGSLTRYTTWPILRTLMGVCACPVSAFAGFSEASIMSCSPLAVESSRGRDLAAPAEPPERDNQGQQCGGHHQRYGGGPRRGARPPVAFDHGR